MKLDRVIDILGWYPDAVNNVEKEFKQAVKQVTKWKEDAECYNNLQLPDNDTMRDYWNRKEIEERMKKRLVECQRNSNEMIVGSSEYNYQEKLSHELQKILGEGKSFDHSLINKDLLDK